MQWLLRDCVQWPGWTLLESLLGGTWLDALQDRNILLIDGVLLGAPSGRENRKWSGQDTQH